MGPVGADPDAAPDAGDEPNQSAAADRVTSKLTRVIGLPGHVRACLFDLDGVLTPTAQLHTQAWKETFDDYLQRRSQRTGEPFVPFDPAHDYLRFVDGRPREDGARAFLHSRGICLPDGTPDDEPGRESIVGLAARKDEVFNRRLHLHQLQPYPGSLQYLHAAEAAGLRRAVVSSSRHCADVLQMTGIEHLVHARVDGNDCARLALAGKPAPDMFLEAARRLQVEPPQAAVFEDAVAGVQAGRAGRFGYVVGIDRAGQPQRLRAVGADVVVADLAELLNR